MTVAIELTAHNLGTFCIYCQKEYETKVKLARHVLRVHPGTYAATHIGASSDPADPTPQGQR